MTSPHMVSLSPFRMLVVLLATGASISTSAQQFTNVAADQGVDILINNDLFGSGVSVYDFDEDGWDDLSFAATNDSLVFYRNNAGMLERLPSFLFGPGETKHVLWVDYDNDGDLDLTVTTRYGTYRLYNNDGNFNFTDVSVQAGLAQFNEETYGTSWGDYDKDGDLDVYFCTYEFEGDDSNYPSLNHLYRNEGDGTFTDVTVAAGVGDSIALSFQSVWIDYDMDGWQDLFVINDRLFPNTMYRNNGDGTFSDVTEATGTALTEHDPMTASVADFDNDGDLDIYMTNTGTLLKKGLLLVNNGDGTFSEMGAEFGVDIPSWSWGATWADVDNDTWQDLYVTTSEPNSPVEDNVFYHSQGGTSFVSTPAWFEGDHNARSFGVGRGDLDNDGFYDLITQNQAPYVPFVWMNAGGSNHWIKVTLQGTLSNRMAIGSWIRVYAGGNCYTQYTLCGENYVGQNSQHHIIGLGDLQNVDSLSVEYISGHTDTYYDLEVGQHYYLVEGETYTASVTPLSQTTFCEGNSVTLDAGDHESYFWNDESGSRYLTAASSGQYYFTAFNEFGIPAYSDTIEVIVNPNPIIESDLVNPLCAGDATGSIELTDVTGEEVLLVEWEHGAEGPNVSDLEAGTYYYLFINVFGCFVQDSVQLIAPPELFLSVTTTPAQSGNDGTADIQVFGGVPPYDILVDGVASGSLTTGMAPGPHDVLVIDAHGCEITEQLVIDDHTGLEELDHSLLVMFPNPVNDHLVLTTDLVLTELSILDGSGRIVRSVWDPHTPRLDVTGLASGSYFLLARIADGRSIRKPFMVTRN